MRKIDRYDIDGGPGGSTSRTRRRAAGNTGRRARAPGQELALIDRLEPEPVRSGNENNQGRSHEVTIIAQDPFVIDPSSKSDDKRILRATVRVLADRLLPGPRSHRFHVVDFNATTGRAGPVEDFSRYPAEEKDSYGWQFEDSFSDAPDKTLLSSHRFYAQNVYAVASRTLAAFEAALGRRIGWSFDSHQLYLVPDALEEANAAYRPGTRGISFGYFSHNGRTVHTCLSHDVIAHETTHAILDGLRCHFFEPGLPDQLALHEGLADIVALLSVFSLPQVVERCLKLARIGEDADPRPMDMDRLAESALFGLGEEIGSALSDGHGRALRESLRLKRADVPPGWKYNSREWAEPHKRGEIVVSAILNTLLKIWQERIHLLAPKSPSPKLIAEEGAKSAQHLLTMVIRAIDYCPPAELEFEDFLDAIMTSDAEVAPDDEHHYRDAVKEAFGEFGITQPEGATIPLYKNPPTYSALNFGEFLIDPDEVFHFIWQNGDRIGIDVERYYTRVVDVQPSVRVGPDGFVVHETVACYVQTVEGTLGDLVKHSREHTAPARPDDPEPRVLVIPKGMTAETQVRLWGGGVLIFDQFGRPKYHQHKDLFDWRRQNHRLRRLVEEASDDPVGRYGFGDPKTNGKSRFHDRLKQAAPL